MTRSRGRGGIRLRRIQDVDDPIHFRQRDTPTRRLNRSDWQSSDPSADRFVRTIQLGSWVPAPLPRNRHAHFARRSTHLGCDRYDVDKIVDCDFFGGTEDDGRPQLGIPSLWIGNRHPNDPPELEWSHHGADSAGVNGSKSSSYHVCGGGNRFANSMRTSRGGILEERSISSKSSSVCHLGKSSLYFVAS